MQKKKVLILTSGKTGGHRSSSDAIKAAILELDPELEVNDKDAFEFYKVYKGEDFAYQALTTKYRYFWKFIFEFGSFFKRMTNFFFYIASSKKFKKFLVEYKPDIILSVHPCFAGSVRMALKKIKLDIPFCTCIIDLVKHNKTWHDKKGALTFVPTAKMKEYLIKKGFKADRVIHSGFPIGDKFSGINKIVKDKIEIPNVLMVAPSLKNRKYNLKLIKATLKHNVNLTVVTANNKKLKKYLDKKLAGACNVAIEGFVYDMPARLASADLLIAKAGPNMILEAVKMGVPVLVSGFILGQEEKNHQYIEDNGYGFRADTPKKLDRALTRLFDNDYELLKQMSENTKNCTDLKGGDIVAKHLVELLNYT